MKKQKMLRTNILVNERDHTQFIKYLRKTGLSFSEFIRLWERLYLAEVKDGTGEELLRKLLEYTRARTELDGVVVRNSQEDSRTRQ